MTDPEQIDQQYYYDRPAMKPTARTYVRHFALLVITFFTSMVAGVMFPFGPINTLPDDDPQTAAQVLEFIINLPVKYAGLIGSTVNEIVTNPAVLSYGLKFSLSLIFILFCHEMGHYIACRLYRVDATLPFFIPTPPLIGPAGTFGAFIKIMSPMPSRRAVFDIGVAGPIAGFIA